MQGLLEEFQARFDNLQELEPFFTFLVNPLDCDVINDGCFVRQTLVKDVSAAEMVLTRLQDLVLKNFNKGATLQWTSGKRLQSGNIDNFKRPVHDSFPLLAQHIAMNFNFL